MEFIDYINVHYNVIVNIIKHTFGTNVKTRTPVGKPIRLRQLIISFGL